MTRRSHLLNEHNAELYRRSVAAGVDRVAARLIAQNRPFTGITADRLAPEISAIDLERPLGDPAAALDELERVYLRDAVYFHHPRYLAHLNCPVVIPALVGEAVLSAVNSSLDTWDQSAGGTLIERRLIDWTAERIGLGEGADGVFTSGGTQSNLQALLLARDEACRLVEKTAPAPLRTSEILPRLRILASECAHFSVTKAAALLGLGEDAVIAVPCDPDVTAVKARQQYLTLDGQPVGNAGTPLYVMAKENGQWRLVAWSPARTRRCWARDVRTAVRVGQVTPRPIADHPPRRPVHPGPGEHRAGTRPPAAC